MTDRKNENFKRFKKTDYAELSEDSGGESKEARKDIKTPARHAAKRLAPAVFLVFTVIGALFMMSRLNRVEYEQGETVMHTENNIKTAGAAMEGRENTEAANVMVMAYINDGKFEKARELMKTAMKPGEVYEKTEEYLREAMLTAGGSRITKAGNVMPAKENSSAAGEQTVPVNETCDMYYRKGRIYYENGDFQKARYYWEKVKRIIDDPSDEMYRQAEDKLKSLK